MIKSNVNHFFSNKILSILFEIKATTVFISPGSRSTPLTLAFANDTRFTKHVFVDERSSGFAALGFSKISKNIPVLVCTSGTAAAEFYPAIIEAHKQRVKLIVITADRPKGFNELGANQSINQKDIYKSNIGGFYQADTPKNEKLLLEKNLTNISNLLQKCIHLSLPVHINLPFDLPLESFTGLQEIEDISFLETNTLSEEKYFNKSILNTGNTIFICGDNVGEEKELLYNLSLEYNIPILAEISSGLRNFRNNVFTYHDLYLRKKEFLNNIKIKNIYYFGGPFISKGIEILFRDTNANIYFVNKYGKVFNPFSRKNKRIKTSIKNFVKLFTSTDNQFLLDEFNLIESKVKSIISKSLSKFNHLSFYTKYLSDIGNTFISNSLPVRDINSFSGHTNSNYFTNRGASGIDGIISTAIGIYLGSNKNVNLITGDLAFFYDLTALQFIKTNNLPIIIFLINNNGGGIFQMLPVAHEKTDFQKYFKTPILKSYKSIVEAFDIAYYTVNSFESLDNIFTMLNENKGPSVVELIVDEDEAVNQRKRIIDQVVNSI